MAIVENFWLKDQTKKLGGAVIYQAMGQTRSRRLATSIANPRTQSQMTQRVKWANLVNLYRANRPWMKYAFETKKASQSDYNKFMSLNVASSNIFLPKNVAAAGGCVVDGYLMTQGSLPSVEFVYDSSNDRWVSNIYLGDGLQLQGMTVATFSRALLDNNPAIREGDQLSFIKMTQLTNSESGVPYVVVREYEMLVSLSNISPVSDYLPDDYIDSTESTPMAQLCVMNSGNAGGFVIVLSRTIGGKTFVSSQRIIVANNNALISAYSSAAALQAAIDSYGVSDEPFLTTTTANRDATIFTPNSIVSMTMDDENKVPGQFIQITKALAGKTLVIRFSAPISGTVTGVRLDCISSGQISGFDMLTPTVVDGAVNATFPAASGLPTNAALYELKVIFDDAIYQTAFAIPNEYTIEGLE